MGENILLGRLIGPTVNVVPPFDPVLVQKILTRHTTFQESKKDIYDILVQSLDHSVDDPHPYYTRAYKVDPKFIIDLFNTYCNTDIEDMNTIFLTLQEKYREYNAKFAYISIDGQKSYKKISSRHVLSSWIKKHLPEGVRRSVEEKAKELGIDNLFEVYVIIEPNCLYFNLAVNVENDADVIDENNQKTKSFWYWPLYFQTTQEIVNFIRNRGGKDGDLFDKIIYE